MLFQIQLSSPHIVYLICLGVIYIAEFFFLFSYYANIQSDAQNKAKIDTTNINSDINFNVFFIVLF